MRVMLSTLKNIIDFVSALYHEVFLSLVRRRPRRVILYYHSVKKKDIRQFEKQMRYLARYCSVVKASGILKTNSNGANFVVGITFDDAFASIWENAIPVLDKYELPASICVPTGNMGRKPSWFLEEDCSDAHETVMNEEQLVELDRLGYEMLSHTVSHPDLIEVDDIQLGAELERSKQTLERIVGHDVLGISYPYGAYNDKVCRLAERIGYRIGFSVEPCSVDFSSDKFQIGRFKVSPMDSMLIFKLKVNGAYEVVKYFRRLKRMLFRP